MPEPLLQPERAAQALVTRSVALLLENGQTTEGARLSVNRLSAALGRPTTLQVRWGQAALHAIDGGGTEFVDVTPANVDIGRVAAVDAVVDAVCAGVLGPVAALDRLDTIGRARPVSLVRFAPMAAAGAAALSVIFGAPNLLTVVLIAIVAGLGACLRRLAARVSSNPLLQPLVAALLAGLAAGLAARTDLPVAHRLLAACPCMVLVPGPHLLNGMIDLVRIRIPLGIARLALAGLIVLSICTGLLTGLSLCGESFPEVGVVRLVPLPLDVLAAGVAVAAYASFFNMSWRMVGVPVVTGMAAHALRWEVLQLGVGAPTGAFAATLVAGATMALLSHRLRLPFGAAAFASVVSLIPGILMIQAASGLVSVARLGPNVGTHLVLGVASDLSTASLTLVAMAAGVILPKLVADALLPRR